LLAVAGCSRCGGTTTANAAEELLPLHPAAAVVTAPLGAVARHLAALIDRASSLPGGEQLGEARRVAAAQLGFDPLAREGLISAGFDPDRAAAVAFVEAQPRAELIAALPVSKPDLFLQTMQRLLVDRGGFSRAEGQSQSATLFERGGTRVAVSVVRGYGLLARTRDPAASIAEAGGRPAAGAPGRGAGEAPRFAARRSGSGGRPRPPPRGGCGSVRLARARRGGVARGRSRREHRRGHRLRIRLASQEPVRHRPAGRARGGDRPPALAQGVRPDREDPARSWSPRRTNRRRL